MLDILIAQTVSPITASTAIIGLSLAAAGTIATAFFWMGKLSTRTDNLEIVAQDLAALVKEHDNRLGRHDVEIGVIHAANR